MEIKIEIGERLSRAIKSVVSNANTGGVDAGAAVKEAFGIDFTQIAINTNQQEANKEEVNDGQ